jgi:hypothetical protein
MKPAATVALAAALGLGASAAQAQSEPAAATRAASPAAPQARSGLTLGGSGEWRLAREWAHSNPDSPYVQAHARWPDRYPLSPNRWSSLLQLKGDARQAVGAEAAWTAHVDLQGTLQHEDAQAATLRSGRVNELYVGSEVGGWQLSAGRRVVSWDVGYAFRPNDVVQREARRPLLPTTPQGRGVVQLEHFGADRATSLVAVEPQRGLDATQFAARQFLRLGGLDAYLHADGRLGGPSSVGSAFAWVAGDELELHGSTRTLPHSGAVAAAGSAAAAAGRHQTLLGASWTGAADSLLPEVTLLGEAWYDGSLATAAQRRNVYLRASTKWDAWEPSLDLLIQPGDWGHTVGAGLRWQGERWRFELAWRHFAGPKGSATAQSPQRDSGAAWVTWPF